MPRSQTLSIDQARKQVEELVQKCNERLRLPEFNEEQTKKDLILPLFRALNWEVEDSSEVSAEETIVRKRVDYGFRLDGVPKFYLEAKALTERLEIDHAKQAINYSWLKSTTWAVLTNFKEIRVYNADWKSRSTLDKLFFQIAYTEFLERFDELWLLSKDSFSTDEIDKKAVKWGHEKKKIPVTPVTEQLFDDLVKWRQKLTKKIATNPRNMAVLKDNENLDESVQRILDRLIFVRVAEDKGLEPKTLRAQWRDWKLVREGKPFSYLLSQLFTQFDDSYDSNLFSHHLCDELILDDFTLNEIVEQLYNGPEEYEYDFGALDVDVLGSIYEEYLGFMLKKFKKRTTVVESYTQRKKMGSYYTPTYIVDFIVKNTVGKVAKSGPEYEQLAVLDMACGSGSFLIRALSFLQSRRKAITMEQKVATLQDSIYGVDLDPKAVQLAQLNLLIELLEKRTVLPFLSKNIQLGNSLVEDDKIDMNAMKWSKRFEQIMSSGGFDVVIGNPPYLDSEEMTRSQPKIREYYATSGLYASAEGNWDIFCLFLEQGLKLLKPGGYLGMIVPNKLLSADYAIAIRRILQENRILTIRDYSTIHVFNAAVYPIVIIVRKEAPGTNSISLEVANQNEVGTISVNKTNEFRQSELSGLATWSPLFNKSENDIFEKVKRISVPCETIADVNGAATVSEAYETMEILTELKNHQHYYKFINTGTIDRYASLWGLQRTRIGKAYEVPIVKKDEVERILPRRAEQASVPKIIIGGMNKRLECYYDEKGEFLAGKTTVIITNPKIKFEVLLGLLNSKLLSFCYRNMFQALSLSGGFMRIGPPQIRLLPIKKPSDSESRTLAGMVNLQIERRVRLGKVGESSDRGKALLEELSNTDAEIDQLVYGIYGLSKEEAKAVNDKLAEA